MIVPHDGVLKWSIGPGFLARTLVHDFQKPGDLDDECGYTYDGLKEPPAILLQVPFGIAMYASRCLSWVDVPAQELDAVAQSLRPAFATP